MDDTKEPEDQVRNTIVNTRDAMNVHSAQTSKPRIDVATSPIAGERSRQVS